MRSSALRLIFALGEDRFLTAAFVWVVAGVMALLPEAGIADPLTNEWITVNKDYSSQRYVDLDQITPANVGRLREICEIELNEPAWFNSGLLMVGRTIYATTLRSTYAVDAVTCDLRWRHDIDFAAIPQTNSNRGAGYLDGTIFRGTGDGRVIALNADTGKLMWQTQGADPTRRETFLAAPIAWDGKVFIGIGISDRDVRGRVAAFDAKDGKELWRFNTIPVGMEPGAETWRNAPSVAPAGGGFWTSYSLDPATAEVFAPVANPYPDYAAGARSGDDLYTNSVISLDATTGKLSWYHQAIAHDDHDWDLGTPPTLYRTRGGKSMLAVAGKDGNVLGIDRANKTVIFKTAGTTMDNVGPVDETLKLVCPGSIGGAQWNGTAYHPGLGILYSGMVDWCFFFSTKNYAVDPGFWEVPEGGTVRPDYSKQPSGWVTAMDGETGKVLWKYHAEAPVLAGLVPTKSGLLFAGDTRGNLLALDAASGALLKTLDAKGALNNGLISYAVNGTQYVAAAVGGLTLNASGVSGPLKVSVYGLDGTETAKIVRLPRAYHATFAALCGSCHGVSAAGNVDPPLVRHAELGDPESLKAFLSSVPPPMPILYPGLLDEDDIRAIAAYLKMLIDGENDKLPTERRAAAGAYTQPTTTGAAPWRAVYSVLTHPRCLNCHTITNYPRQGDDRHPHIYGVVRGTDDLGAPLARCSACHGATNNASTGIPGRSDWHIAPLSMAWESAPGIAMTGDELCRMLKDRVRNGNRGFAELVEHVETEHLVIWAWDPGTRWNKEARKTPPISHEEFVKLFQDWASGGAGCPGQ
jgi:alcohol dehydrogenase (cytochrome c)